MQGLVGTPLSSQKAVFRDVLQELQGGGAVLGGLLEMMCKADKSTV